MIIIGVDVIILAAGFSSRVGAFKMELAFGEKNLLERCIDSFEGLCSKIIVVGGYQIEKIEAITKNYENVELVLNEEYESGMFRSVKTGLKKVESERFFLTPGDYPLIDKNICRKMLELGNDIVIPTYEGKKGHPILMNSSLIPEILSESSDSNLRNYTYKKEYKLFETNDEGIIRDIDTMSDYEQISKELKKDKLDTN